MATKNCWRARKIQAELSKLGIRVSLATISRYLPEKERDPTQQQRLMTFLRNHKDAIAGMVLVVPQRMLVTRPDPLRLGSVRIPSRTRIEADGVSSGAIDGS